MSDDFDLVATLRDALQFATGHVQGAVNALSLLSDRSALLWELLEAEAGEVVEVKQSVFHAHGDGSWIETGFAMDCRIFAEILESGEGVDIETGVGSDNLRTADNARSMILCLARAIQEQKKWEAGVQGA